MIDYFIVEFIDDVHEKSFNFEYLNIRLTYFAKISRVTTFFFTIALNLSYWIYPLLPVTKPGWNKLSQYDDVYKVNCGNFVS